jgi:hypothetical protein
MMMDLTTQSSVARKSGYKEVHKQVKSGYKAKDSLSNQELEREQ